MTTTIVSPWTETGGGTTARYRCVIDGEDVQNDATKRGYATATVVATIPEVVSWVEDVLRHSKTVAVRLDTRGRREHYFQVGARARREITEVIAHALDEGNAVVAEISISSLVHQLRLVVTIVDGSSDAASSDTSASVGRTGPPR